MEFIKKDVGEKTAAAANKKTKTGGEGD